MIELRLQKPYIDENGKVFNNLERHYAEDENGVKYHILQVETGIEYAEAVDIAPCRYTYKVTDKLVEVSCYE
jgi:hypothetical protein